MSTTAWVVIGIAVVVVLWAIATYNRLVAARREHLAELWPEWSPKKREEVYEILRRLARELIPEANAAST